MGNNKRKETFPGLFGKQRKDFIYGKAAGSFNGCINNCWEGL